MSFEGSFKKSNSIEEGGIESGISPEIQNLKVMVEKIAIFHDDKKIQPYVNEIALTLDKSSTFNWLRTYLNKAPALVKQTLLFSVLIRMGLLEGHEILTEIDFDNKNKAKDEHFKKWSNRIIKAGNLLGPEVKAIFEILLKIDGMSNELTDGVRRHLETVRLQTNNLNRPANDNAEVREVSNNTAEQALKAINPIEPIIDQKKAA